MTQNNNKTLKMMLLQWNNVSEIAIGNGFIRKCCPFIHKCVSIQEKSMNKSFVPHLVHILEEKNPFILSDLEK
jgi:hypothetical protein